MGGSTPHIMYIGNPGFGRARFDVLARGFDAVTFGNSNKYAVIDLCTV
jgi:hypothetical protein